MQRQHGSAPTRLGPSTAATECLDAVALPLLQIDAAGSLVFANAAARSLAIEEGDWALWLAQVGAWQNVPPEGIELALPSAGPQGGNQNPPCVRVQARSLAEGGWLLTLHPLHAQAELQAAHKQVEQLQEMLDLARDFGRLGLWERDARTLEGRWDRQVLKFRGLPEDTPTPRFEESLAQVAAADREALERAFRESLRKPGSYSHRYSLRAPDGTLRRVHSQWLVKAGPDGQPARAVGLLLDDTETLALAGASGEIESELALAVDMGRIAIWRHDLRTQRMHYNAQAWSVLDIPARPEGLHIDEVRAMIHPDDVPAVLASARVAVQSNKPTDMEARYRRRDGTWRYVLTRRVVQRDADGSPLAFLGVAMDVTERRNADIALRSAAERAALVARAAGLGTWEVDMRDGTTFWDEQMWLLRGLPPQPRAMTQQERMAVVHPDDRERMQALNDVSRDPPGPSEAEFRVLWPDGQVRWLATRSKTVRDEDGLPVRRLGVNWDITDARSAAAMRQERELARLESAAKSQFMARMSHELRTPLNAVLGFTQLLIGQEAGTSPVTAAASRRAWLQHVEDAAQHLLALINDLLDLAALDSGELRTQPALLVVPALLQTTLPMLDPLLKERAVQLQAQVPPVTVIADETRLRQVLLNLLGNAIRHCAPGGQVVLRGWAAASGERVHLSVADSSRVVPPEQLPHLFEPFNRLGPESPGAEGSGVELSIARSLVERMGGQLQVQCLPGEGTVFEIDLPAPAAAPAPEAASPSSAMLAAPVAAQVVRKLLYIEDNPVNAMIIAELLARREDLVLHVAADGGEGVAMTRSLLPDLVLLDMQLPDIDGLEVMRQLQALPATAHIPCIALSANAMPEDIDRALKAGACDYWTKPLDFRAFMAALDKRLGLGAD